MQRTLVVVPTYNEAFSIERLAHEILSLPLPIDLLIVDDDSPDGTADVIAQRFAGEPRCRLLRRRGPRSFAQSLLDGYRCALREGYAAALQMDADFSHAPSYLAAILDAATYADVVVGSRYVEGGRTADWTLPRRALSGAGNWYLRLATGLPEHDVTSGFRLYRREALEKIGLDTIVSTGFCFQAEMTVRAHRAGLRIVELPIRFENRRCGASKLTAAIAWESLLLPWRLRGSGVPARSALSEGPRGAGTRTSANRTSH